MSDGYRTVRRTGCGRLQVIGVEAIGRFEVVYGMMFLIFFGGGEVRTDFDRSETEAKAERNREKCKSSSVSR